MPAASRASSSSAGPRAQPEMPQDERPRRGRAASARPVAAPARGTSGRRWQQAAGRPSCRTRLPAAAAAANPTAGAREGGGGLFDFFGGGGQEQEEPAAAGGPDLSQHRPERPLPLRLRAAVRRLLLSDQLFHLCQPPGAGRDRVPVELRGARRALRLSQSRTRDRAGHLAERLGLYGPSRRAQISQGLCEGLLLQAGRIQSDRDRGRQQEAEAAAGRPARPRRGKEARGAGCPGGSPCHAGPDGEPPAQSRRDRQQQAAAPAPPAPRRCPGTARATSGGRRPPAVTTSPSRTDARQRRQ